MRILWDTGTSYSDPWAVGYGARFRVQGGTGVLGGVLFI